MYIQPLIRALDLQILSKISYSVLKLFLANA
jgi:hypothetical protein